MLLGPFTATTGPYTVGATADVFPAGRWFLVNPAGSAVVGMLGYIYLLSQLGSALAAPTSPRLTVCKFTFTGTPSGATITPAYDSQLVVPTLSLRSAATGMTMAKGADIHSFLPVASATAVGYTPPSDLTWQPPSPLILRAGEGVMLYQPDAGTVADTRRYTTTLSWQEQ